MNRTIDTYRSRLQDQKRAEQYATRFERGARRRIDQREQHAVRNIFSGLPDCRSVLDVPCGAGRFSAVLAENQREVTGMDMAAEALEFGRQRNAKLGIAVRYLQGDAGRTGLPDASVDAVFCNRLLHHITNVPERAAFLREFHRITRRHLILSFFDYRSFGAARVLLKKLKGRKVNYDGQPTLAEFSGEVARCGFVLKQVATTGAFWVAQKYFVLEKMAMQGSVLGIDN